MLRGLETIFAMVIQLCSQRDFCGSAANVIHPSNPLHLIVCFELFGHALTLCHLFYEPKKHILSLIVYIGKVSVQLAFCLNAWLATRKEKREKEKPTEE